MEKLASRNELPVAAEPMVEGRLSAVPAMWVDAQMDIAQHGTALVELLFKVDTRINELNTALAATQPFGSRKVELRWYDNGRGRRDPVPVLYVRRTHPQFNDNPGSGWSVVRLDRNGNQDVPLNKHIRTTGPFSNSAARRPAVKIARQIEALMADRTNITATLGQLRHRAAVAAPLLRRINAHLTEANKE